MRECKFEFFLDGKVYANNGYTYSWGSRDEYISFCATALVNMQTMHSIGPGEFELVSEGEVKAVFPVTYFAAQKNIQSASGGMQGGGYYFETYKRVNDDWMMIDSKMQRMYEK